MIASLGNSPLNIQKNCYSVATGKIQLSYKENINCMSCKWTIPEKKKPNKGRPGGGGWGYEIFMGIEKIVSGISGVN